MARRRRKRIKNRFYVVVTLFLSVVIFSVALILRGRNSGEIEMGSIEGAELEVSAALVRDEIVVATERYEKVIFDVIEGQTVENGTQIAQVFKRGYQDESMISLINTEKQIYEKQLALLAGTTTPELTDANERIATVEAQIRSSARGESDLDMLTLEQQLKTLQSERIGLLRTTVTADAALNTLYTQLAQQETALASWKRNITNNSGTGVVSFYFDGYEQALNANKLSTVNSALISSVVKGGNTTKTTSSGSETPLYRLINNTHWFIAFVTNSSDAFRLTAGESYYVTFKDYSSETYQAIAREPVVSDKSVANILEFNVDLGKLAGIRTVSAVVSKAAQGLMVPVDALDMLNGIAGINIKVGDTPLRVEVNVIATDGKKAIIQPRNATDSLAAGQKYVKP